MSPARRLARRVCLILAAAALVFGAAPPAEAAGPVYSGTGWKILTSYKIRSLDPTSPYVFTFTSAAARTRLTPYLKPIAAQLTSVTGITFTVSAIVETVPAGSCPPKHHIVYGLKYRPTGENGMSQALPCYHTVNYSAWGGRVWMDSEYWYPGWPMTETKKRNAVAHEAGHVVGLDHPNYDRDRDGRVEPYECVRTSAGIRPLMCSPNGGFTAAASGGKFTTVYDVPGLRQLVQNWAYRPQ